jgi:predicted metal-dependent phosphoesterase TrpH
LPKIDLHVHSRLSKGFEFNEQVILQLKELGIRRGLDGFALTEHVHANHFWEMHEYLRSRHDYHDGWYDLDDGFRMFSGYEVTVGERIDFIVVGALDQLEKLDGAFYPKLSESNFVPGLDFLSTARRYDVLVISAHPFRPGKETVKLPLDQVFGMVDAIEVNGRDYGREQATAELAARYDRPLSGGSDAHYYLQVGVRSTIVPGESLSFEGVHKAFESHQTRAHCKSYARSVVEFCKEIKNVTKQRKGMVALAEAVG